MIPSLSSAFSILRYLKRLFFISTLAWCIASSTRTLSMMLPLSREDGAWELRIVDEPSSCLDSEQEPPECKNISRSLILFPRLSTQSLVERNCPTNRSSLSTSPSSSCLASSETRSRVGDDASSKEQNLTCKKTKCFACWTSSSYGHILSWIKQTMM